MNAPPMTRQLAQEIREIFRSDPSQAAERIESLLAQKFESAADDPVDLLQRVKSAFPETLTPAGEASTGMEDEVLSKTFSLLLGRDVSQADFSSKEVLYRLAESLNTIFDTLNQLIQVINSTLLVQDTPDKTIRVMIGSHLEGENQGKPLEAYLGQIQKAFLTTQQVFKNAAYAKVKEFLEELDPVQIDASVAKGFKFGPLRKAECFDIYEEKYKRFKKWFESGRFTEAFLREFEKNCRKLSE